MWGYLLSLSRLFRLLYDSATESSAVQYLGSRRRPRNKEPETRAPHQGLQGRKEQSLHTEDSAKKPRPNPSSLWSPSSTTEQRDTSGSYSVTPPSQQARSDCDCVSDSPLAGAAGSGCQGRAEVRAAVRRASLVARVGTPTP